MINKTVKKSSQKNQIQKNNSLVKKIYMKKIQNQHNTYCSTKNTHKHVRTYIPVIVFYHPIRIVKTKILTNKIYI